MSQSTEQEPKSDKIERKRFSLEIKVDKEDEDSDKGLVTAMFAQMGVVDRGGDIIEKGAFGEQDVVVSAFNHASYGFMSGDLPVGKGRIFEKGDEAIAELQFFLNTEGGKEHFETIKAMGGLQEYSFGFQVTKTGELSDEMRKAGVDRVIKSVDVFEVSPVFLGEGINTRTLALKSKKHEPSEEEQKAAQKEQQASAQELKDQFDQIKARFSK